MTDRKYIDECEACGQETFYRCSRIGGEPVCEGCYERAIEVIGL